MFLSVTKGHLVFHVLEMKLDILLPDNVFSKEDVIVRLQWVLFNYKMWIEKNKKILAEMLKN